MKYFILDNNAHDLIKLINKLEKDFVDYNLNIFLARIETFYEAKILSELFNLINSEKANTITVSTSEMMNENSLYFLFSTGFNEIETNEVEVILTKENVSDKKIKKFLEEKVKLKKSYFDEIEQNGLVRIGKQELDDLLRNK